MHNATEQARFKFISHALRGDGPFRPAVYQSADGVSAAIGGETYLVRYPRESDAKFARRNEIAFFASPLSLACSRFAGYLASMPVTRELPNPLMQRIADDVDGRGNAVDVFWSSFIVDAKARGSMLLLVDMPPSLPATQDEQIRQRMLPFWTPIRPELVTDYAVGDDGRFDFVEFSGNYTMPDGKRVSCTWHFDRSGWAAHNEKGEPLDAGDHPLGECPVLIFSESGDFPCFGPFAAIADLSRRLFNAESELDEILRSQTFSLLTMQVPDDSSDQQKLSAAQIAGQSIGTNNLLVHSGSTPAFIAPPDGPASIYLERIKQLKAQIDEIGLNVATVDAQESGIAMQMRFQAINAELSSFSRRMEDLERRAWDLSRRWVGLTQEVDVEWPRDFNISDIERELTILREMTSGGMPPQVIAQQQKRIVSLQFSGLDVEDQDALAAAIDERAMETAIPDNVVPLRPDPNAAVRESIVRMASGGA